MARGDELDPSDVRETAESGEKERPQARCRFLFEDFVDACLAPACLRTYLPDAFFGAPSSCPSRAHGPASP